MRRDLIAKKKKILKRVSLKEYRELLAFVEKIYLAENSLKVLLARKCSNLFFSLIDLVREEDGGRVQRLYEQKFSGIDKPIIISNRALRFYSQSIKEGLYKDILIVDDVILHGTTISQLYEEISSLLDKTNSKIEVWAYAANDGRLLDREYIVNADIVKKVSFDKCRAITDMIIDIFYLIGQPYTSYIPNVILKLNSEMGKLMQEFVKHPDICELTDEEHRHLNMNAYAWVPQKKWECSLFQSIRIYIDEELEQCVIVPMVSLLPINEKLIFSYSKIIEKYFYNDSFNKMCNICTEWCYRAIIYVLSTIWCRQFFIEYLEYTTFGHLLENASEEETNFGVRILNQEEINQINHDEICKVVECLSECYQSEEIDNLLQFNSDFATLDNEIEQLVQNDFEEDTSLWVQRFLRINGKLEEKNWKECCKNKNNISKRLLGYPIAYLPNRIKSHGEKKNTIYELILKAIDFGRGSIVAKKYTTEQNTYFISILQAGEQNYKYTEFKYFPFIYGLFEIERMAREKGEEAAKYKEQYMNEFIKADETQHIRRKGRYFKNDLKELCIVDVSAEYKAVLLNDVWNYPDKDGLNIAINLADKIISSGVVATNGD